MAQRMTAQIQGLNMAIKNSNDGIAMTKSIEGAIAEVSDMLQRMRELSIQAANGTNSASDRTYLQDEVNLLLQEVTRVSANTRYNGSLILDGNEIVHVGIHKAQTVDTTGAGDTYAAGFLHGWLRGWPLGRCADLGARLAALTVSQVGAVCRDQQAIHKALSLSDPEVV